MAGVPDYDRDMGIADSPLKDRAIFVQGAPRSGTTWLLTLLATHPQIAGVEAESHLFQSGLDRLFDNYDCRDPHLRGLVNYLERREQLVDLIRDLCDGVLLAMRAHVSRGAEAEFVVEKTPTSFTPGSPELRYKRECYPDAWYLHIVRDGEAVTRSLMRAPWVLDRTEAACRHLWQDCVQSTRRRLGDHPRYREVRYEELQADPTRLAGEIFRWLGIDAGEETLGTVRALSRERFSELGSVPSRPARGPFSRLQQRHPHVAATARAMLTRVRSGIASQPRPNVDGASPLAFDFARALRDRDANALAVLTAESLTLTYRSADGDFTATGAEARGALLELANRLFSRRHLNELWSTAGGGPREWWTRAPGVPFWSIFFSALGSDATRVDLAFGLTLRDAVIDEVLVVSAGALGGRPVRLSDEADVAMPADDRKVENDTIGVDGASE